MKIRDKRISSSIGAKEKQLEFLRLFRIDTSKNCLANSILVVGLDFGYVFYSRDREQEK
jgi:hypothetical protein